MSQPRLLEGVRITDMTSVFFGPYCTQTLADLGAEVIKLEAASGDTARLVGNPPKTEGMGPVFMRLNRGKRFIDWDLRGAPGRKAMRRLLETTDVFIHNIRLDGVERLGLGYEAVKEIRPDIIYVHGTGFDQRGPYASLQAYDDIIQASTGLASLLPMADGEPRPRFLPAAIADKVSGLHAVYGVLAAVIHKLRTGEGQHVEVPMFESMASFNTVEHFCDNSYVPPTASPGYYQRQLDPTRQPVKTKDGWIAFAPYLDDRWIRFFNAAGHGYVLEREELIDPPTRRANMSIMFEEMARISPERTTDEWLELCREANVPAMRVNAVHELPNDEQLKASGLFREREHPTEGPYIEVGMPVRFSAAPDRREHRHAAKPGHHSEEVARELGLNWPLED